MNFATLKGLTIPEGVVTQITDASGRVIWAVQSDKPIVLEVEKFTSDTYAGETTYTGEQFILLDIFPKTNGTVSVTYGGLTKTITDTSGAEEPNAQQVVFGTFNGVTHDTTPASGELTIEGDYAAFGAGVYKTTKSDTKWCGCITAVADFGNMTSISGRAFAHCNKLISVDIPPSVKTIGAFPYGSLYPAGSFYECTGLERVVLHEGLSVIAADSFYGCVKLASIVIPSTVQKIAGNPFPGANNRDCYVEVDSKNTMYKIDGSCLVEIASNTLLSGFRNSVIPSYIQVVGTNAFKDCTSLASIKIPASVTELDGSPFIGCTGLVSVIFENPSGWYVTTTKGGDLSTGTAVDVSDPANNATLLTDTYAYNNRYWYRS